MDVQDFTPEQQELLAKFQKGMSAESATAIVSRMAEMDERIASLTAATADDDEVARLREELDAATARADAAEKERDHHRQKATALAKQVPSSPRKLGQLAAGKGIDDAAKLRAAIAEADEVEIAFSDGRHEVKGLAPQAITGSNAWKDHPAGLLLSVPLTLHGPAAGHTSYVVNGYALLLDGKQVAYAAASTPHHVAANQTVRLENEIVFA